MRYAIVRNDLVENVVEWDGVSAWVCPEGAQAVATDVAGLGWTHVGGVFNAPPVLPPSFAESKTAKRVAIDAAFLSAQRVGMSWLGKHIQLRILEDDIGNITGAADLAKEAIAGNMVWPANFAWRTADNSPLPLDAPGMRAMALAAGAFFYAMRVVYWTKVDALVAAQNQAAVDVIDPATGWPP